MYERIKALCEQNGTTIKQLEKELGFGAATIAHWKDSVPKVDKLLLVAIRFGVSMEWLVLGDAKISDMEIISVPKEEVEPFLGLEKQNKKPAPGDGDGLVDALKKLNLKPELLETLVRFLAFAKEDQEKAERFLSFAAQEFESHQQEK